MSGDLDATATARVAGAAAERRRLRELREADVAGASMAGVLATLAERDAVVAVGLRSGRTLRARIDAVGADVVVAVSADGRLALLGIDAVTSVTVPGERTPIGGVGAGAPQCMADIVADRARQRPRISVWLEGDPLIGTLVGAGRDLAVVVTDGPGEVAYVRLDSTTEISLSFSSSE